MWVQAVKSSIVRVRLKASWGDAFPVANNNKKPMFWITAVAVVACVVVAICFLVSSRISLPDKKLIQQSYPSAYACAFENYVEVEKEDVEIIRSGAAIEVVFHATNGEQLIRVTNIIKDGKIYSQSTIIEEIFNPLSSADARKRKSKGQ